MTSVGGVLLAIATVVVPIFLLGVVMAKFFPGW